MLIFAFLLFPAALPDALDVDLHRFPGIEVCASAVTLNRAYLIWLDEEAATCPARATWFLAARQETVECGVAWHCLYDLRRRQRANMWGVDERLTDADERARVMELLKDALGEADFRRGRMPGPVPVHRFTRLN